MSALNETSLTITWIRHGQTGWNAEGRWQGHSECPLSDKGREQARALGRRFARGATTFDKVFSSDLGRALETAQLALPGTDITVDPRLREIHFGVFEGRSLPELEAAERDEVMSWWRSPYGSALRGGGESMEDLRARVAAWRAELAEFRQVAVFTHGGVIRDALWRETSAPEEGRWSFLIENTSLTVIQYGPGRNVIARVNDCAHLELCGG